MYNIIINPIDKTIINLHTKLGKNILKKYIRHYIGGATSNNSECDICYMDFKQSELKSIYFINDDRKIKKLESVCIECSRQLIKDSKEFLKENENIWESETLKAEIPEDTELVAPQLKRELSERSSQRLDTALSGIVICVTCGERYNRTKDTNIILCKNKSKIHRVCTKCGGNHRKTDKCISREENMLAQLRLAKKKERMFIVCPSCLTPQSRPEACTHGTCANCKTQFCALCGIRWINGVSKASTKAPKNIIYEPEECICGTYNYLNKSLDEQTVKKLPKLSLKRSHSGASASASSSRMKSFANGRAKFQFSRNSFKKTTKSTVKTRPKLRRNLSR